MLVMTVEPGFGGQSFMPDMLPKIRELRAMEQQAAGRRAAKGKPSLHIEVDGGINARTAALCCRAGADVLVAGSYVFGSDDPAAAIRTLEQA